MPRQSVPRELALYIDRVLREYTDAGDFDADGAECRPLHALSSGDIRERLRRDFGVDVTSKTVTRFIGDLKEFYDRPLPYGQDGAIAQTAHSDAPSAKQWYWMQERLFEPSEVEYLATLVRNAPRVRNPEKLCEKLGCLVSSFQRSGITDGCAVESDARSVSARTSIQALLYSIDVLEQAIAERRTVSFSYVSSASSADGAHIDPAYHERVVPYCVECVEGYYYVASKGTGGRRRFKTLRVDRMRGVELGEPLRRVDPVAYAEKQRAARRYLRASVNRMPSERIEPVRVRCFSKKAAAIICENFADREGFARLTMEGALPAEFTFCVAAEGFAYWAMKFIEDIEVVEPEGVRAHIVRMIENNRYGVPCARLPQSVKE